MTTMSIVHNMSRAAASFPSHLGLSSAAPPSSSSRLTRASFTLESRSRPLMRNQRANILRTPCMRPRRHPTRTSCNWQGARPRRLNASPSPDTDTDTDTEYGNARAGLPVYKPASYDALVTDAAKALSCALDDNKSRLEVEFPPLPSSISGYKGSSDEFIDANIQLVLALIRKLHELRGAASCRVVFPDKPEKRRASRVFKSALQLTSGISFGSLDDIPGGAGNNFLRSIQNAFDFDFESDDEETWKKDESSSMFFFVNCSTSELPAVETYVDAFATELPAVLFNLELDTLRADLGLFGFPTKEVHYLFLSQFLPVFYIRTREYSKSIATAPFVLDYSGALFRMYPGPWQVMLKQADGSFVCVAESRNRFTLGQTKQELLTALGLQEEEGSTMEFLRRGYKKATWWEEDIELEASTSWRN